MTYTSNYRRVKNEAAILGFNVRVTLELEFRVCPKGGKEAQAYYTDDAEDAIGTMRAEAARNSVQS